MIDSDLLKRIDRGKNSQDFRFLSEKDWLDGFKEKRVLDLGCGSGLYTQYLKKLGINPIAFDINKESTKLTKDYVGKQDIFSCCGTCVELPFRKESFDLVLCIETLSHIRNEDQLFALEEINRIIKENGILILSVHNATRFALQNIVRLKKPTEIYENPGLTIYPFSLSQLKKQLILTGFLAKKVMFINFYNSIHQRYPKIFPILSIIENILARIPILKRVSLTIMCMLIKRKPISS
tara:strand:- start:757 stop:1467 length:711 start_codon:yes stop_codon:yes gene_type:complete